MVDPPSPIVVPQLGKQTDVEVNVAVGDSDAMSDRATASVPGGPETT
jgi:hypothetical protein